MARPNRILFPNAWYHIMNRGAGRQQIFRTDGHRRYFLELLSEVVAEFNLEIHAFCLMSNHYHLLVKTPSPTLSEAMQSLSSNYTRKFNWWTKRDGPLFRSRYKTVVIDADSYLVQVSRYIHRNPVEAKLVSVPAEYPWSSYRYYLHEERCPDWLKTNAVLAKISAAETKCRDEYQRFVENGNIASLKQFYHSSRLPGVLGSKEFRHHVSGLGFSDEIRHEAHNANPTVEACIIAASKYYSVPASWVVKGVQGRSNPARTAALWLSVTQTGIALSELAGYFNVSIPSFRIAASRAVCHMNKSPELAGILESLVICCV
jgi:putative transposase